MTNQQTEASISGLEQMGLIFTALLCALGVGIAIAGGDHLYQTLFIDQLNTVPYCDGKVFWGQHSEYVDEVYPLVCDER